MRSVSLSLPGSTFLALVLALALVPAAQAANAVPAADAADPEGTGGLAAATLSLGAFDVVDGDPVAVEAGVELAWTRFTLPLGGWSIPLVPVLGAMATEDASAYGYAGVRLDLPLGERFVLSPQIAAGLYERGDGADLGGAFHFRSAIELAAVVAPRHRLGLVFYHLSNASFKSRNPGSESLALTWRVALGSD